MRAMEWKTARPPRPWNPDEFKAMRWVWSLGGLRVRDLATRVWTAFDRNDDFGRAAQLAYYFILSLFPLLIVLSSLLGMAFASDLMLYERLLNYLATVMPPSAYDLVRTVITDITTGASGGKLSLGLIVTLWTASLGMEALIQGLNVAYEIREFRAWWRRRLLAIFLTLLLTFIASTSVTLIFWGDQIRDWLAGRWGFGWWFLMGWSVLQWLYVAVVALLALNIVYVFGPNLKQQRWQAIMPGSVVALFIWLAASTGFKIYLQYFDSYAKTYGSLGAIIVLLIWLYLSALCILAGGEVNSQILQAAARRGAPASELPAEGHDP